jgi:hypothetical protein
MRRSLFTLICAFCIVQTATAQLTLVPRIGVENSRALVRVDNNSFFVPASARFSPQASLRLDYRLKSGHGFFAGASTSNMILAFNFSNPETSLSNYFTSRGTTQIRFEGGYQFNSKPILLKNTSSSSSKKRGEQKSSSYGKGETGMKRQCGSYQRSSSCGSKGKEQGLKQIAKKNQLGLRLQPQIGMAFIPSPQNDFSTKQQAAQTNYTYNAGNWNTAIVTGMGFEFAKGRTKLFQVNLQYLKGVGNMNTSVLETMVNNKSVTTAYASRASAWSLSIGVPISFAKKTITKNKAIEKAPQQQKKSCEQIRQRCSGFGRF